ncbi:Glb-16 [Aphelenchoides fujianensis]|nr:Glb-16 [Aphelenchoides fujianensis]
MELPPKFLVEVDDFGLTATGELFVKPRVQCNEEEEECEAEYAEKEPNEEYNLWFEDYGKALRQKTDISLGLDKAEHAGSTPPPHLLRCLRSLKQCIVSSPFQPYAIIRPFVKEAVAATERIRHYNYDVKLNKLQKRALRFTWHRLHTRNGGKRVENVFEEIYDRLMRMMPNMREMFTTRSFLSAMTKNEHFTGMRDHARFTVKMFDSVIKNLDTEDNKRTDTLSEYDPILIGKAHTCLRPFGFVSAMWEKLGETIIDVVLVQEAVRDLPGAGQAWVVLTACVVDQLRAGFESSQRSYGGGAGRRQRRANRPPAR